jgi:chemotaxis protein histidine kinase CheA
MSEDMKRYHQRKRHVHSWVWDGVGGRCTCGADITNEEAGWLRAFAGTAEETLAEMKADAAEIARLTASLATAEAQRADAIRRWTDASNDNHSLNRRLATARADALEEAAAIAENSNYGEDAADDIRRHATASPTAPPPEKTTPGSPAPQTASSGPPSGDTGRRAFSEFGPTPPDGSTGWAGAPHSAATGPYGNREF